MYGPVDSCRDIDSKQGSGPPPSQAHIAKERKKKSSPSYTNRGQERNLFVFCCFLSLPCSASSNVCNSLLYSPFHMRERTSEKDCVCDVCVCMHRESRRASALGAGRRRRRRSLEVGELNSYLASSQSEALLRLTKTAGPGRASLPHSSFKALAEVCCVVRLHSTAVCVITADSISGETTCLCT